MPKCSSCNGEGTITIKEKCPDCKGQDKECTNCNGKGYEFFRFTCPTCHGYGYTIGYIT